MTKNNFENEMQVIIDFQERDESDIGDKIFNLKKRKS